MVQYGPINQLIDCEEFNFLMSVQEYDHVISVLRFVNNAFDKRKSFDILV